MFDINAIINAAITAAVTEATKPLLERITALETKLTEAKLFEQTTNVTIPIDEASMVEAFNSQEWFWDKINGFVESRVEEAMADHCSSYDHDEYDNMYNEWGCEDVSDFVKDGDIADTVEEKLRDILNNASLSISL
jgi:hypothetical protein